MESSLENLLKGIKVFDNQLLFNSRNRLGLGKFGLFYQLLQKWVHAMKCKRRIAQVYSGLINAIDPKHSVLDPGLLHKPEECVSDNIVMLMNGSEDFSICINLALDGYLTNLSSLLDCLSQIANSLMFRRTINNVSFRKLAMDCKDQKSTFEDIIVRNYYFPGNPAVSNDVWTNHFKQLRNSGVHNIAFFPAIGNLAVVDQANPFKTRKLNIQISSDFFDDLPTTTSHDIRTYTQLLNKKIDDFIPAAVDELIKWLTNQKHAGEKIPVH